MLWHEVAQWSKSCIESCSEINAVFIRMLYHTVIADIIIQGLNVIQGFKIARGLIFTVFTVRIQSSNKFDQEQQRIVGVASTLRYTNISY